jgi:uncharacterized protein
MRMIHIQRTHWIGRVGGVSFALIAMAAHAQGVLDPSAPTAASSGKGFEVKILKSQPTAKPSGPAAVATQPVGRPATSVTAKQQLPSKTPAAVAGAPNAKPQDDSAYEAFEQGRYLTALQLAEVAAKSNDPQAHTLAARIHNEGLGVPENKPMAAQWYARAAELGDMEGAFGYGVLLAEGAGVPKDRVAAGRMFEAAALKGHVLANYNLAMLFLKGDGKPENPYRAAKHLEYAASQGVVVAQYDLGTLYATGVGIDPNASEAAKWIGRAAAAGYADAELDYAVMLFQGRGVPVSQEKGVAFFRSAADKGVVVAQNRLARCYAFGAGVKADLGEAAKWHFIAKSGGLNDDGLESLVGKLGKAGVAKAQAAAIAWREQTAVAGAAP